MPLLPAHGQEVIVRFPDSDWEATAFRVDAASEQHMRHQQDWQPESIVLQFTGTVAGTLPPAVYDFLGEVNEGGHRLFFDVSAWSGTGWSLLLERDEFPVILEFGNAL